jgi:cytochrome c-type biogenesis protein
MDVSLALAFAAGLLSFATPCVLALVPVYLAFLGDEAAGPSPSTVTPIEGATALRQPLVGQALLFCFGFTSVFIFFGVSIGLLGSALFAIEPLRQAAGLAVIGLGVLTTGVFGPVLDRFRSPVMATRLPAARSARSVSLGALFAIGWTPCIGPVLGAILGMGASSQNVGLAALLLVSYSAGLALPFLAASVALPQLRPLMVALRRNHRVVEVLAGLFIIAMGVLIFFDAFSRMASLWVIW